MLTLDLASSAISDFQQKVIVGVVSAILAFLSTLFFERRKTRLEPRKELTWVAHTQAGLVTIDPQFQERVALTYDGDFVDNLSSVDFKVQNTGNEVIKNHLIRFTFPNECRVLETRLSPEPERELKVQRDRPSEEGTNEVVYRIGHLEAGQEVGLQIVASGTSAKDWKPHSHNDEGNVRFEERSQARAKDDSEHLTPFLVLTFALLAIPPFLEFTPTLGEFLSYAFRGTMLILLTPHIAPTSRLIKQIATQRRDDESFNITMHGAAALQIARAGGVNRMSVPRQRPTDPTGEPEGDSFNSSSAV
ncbi:hypothetical protein ACIQUU_16720 [Streptomyces sp. NPDC101116]|uniref:hypothetical protein n=1 Tax=Streptomyces sp. NPDC101116 TaxID=3366107 RepID=UPI00382CD0E6